MITGPLYTCVQIHFTDENTSCSSYLSVIIQDGRLAVYLFVSLWRAVFSVTFLMKKRSVAFCGCSVCQSCCTGTGTGTCEKVLVAKTKSFSAAIDKLWHLYSVTLSVWTTGFYVQVSPFGTTLWGIKLHLSCWYNNFAKLCHTMIVFGIYMHMRISHCLPVWWSL